jgi:alpha-glucosidase
MAFTPCHFFRVLNNHLKSEYNMNTIRNSLRLLLLIIPALAGAQTFTLFSPDNKISVTVFNGDTLSYQVSFNGKAIVNRSMLGFEFRDEDPMKGNFTLTDKMYRTVNEKWTPVIRSKHSEIINKYNELTLFLKEKTGKFRKMEFVARAYDDGMAFRFRLLRAARPGDRQITKELTTFNIPGDPKAWVVEYSKEYSSSNEAEFFERPLHYLSEKTIAGMPFLMDYGNNCWVAITEAEIDNYPAFYIGTTGKTGSLTTKLVPVPGEPENGVKARFADEVLTPWRVLIIGDNPGKLIESEIIQNLNEPCAIADPSWIIPGMSAWDNWWSGDVKMEMPVIKKYIDMASFMGWRYMIVDWNWYGKPDDPASDITKWAPQISIPEIVDYASSKNVKIILWVHSNDANLNSAYKEAFPLYHKWGIAGVKIDFMDRDDQQMVNWYHEIIKCAAVNRLLVDFHGAYKPDGIMRTWPNQVTREGVMGNEYYKFSDNMSPRHNIKLAFTRMLAGPMDYTPGAFLNVSRDQFKNQVPAVVWNTRAAELSKFVIYESPFTVVCDHPDNIIGKPGADFLKIVPTVWDDTRFLGGYPGDWVAIARRSGNEWFIGVMNDTTAKKVTIQTDFLGEENWELEVWSDTGNSDKQPMEMKKAILKIKANDKIIVSMAKNGGWVAVARKKQ